MTSSVRKLRNNLEEVEEVFDDARTAGPDDSKLLSKVAQSGHILGRLDLALQSYRCSKHKDVNERTVDDLRTELDVTTQELHLAFEDISTGEIQLQLDTSIIADATAATKTSSTRWHSASSTTADSTHERKSSRTSSAWSLVPRDSPSQGSNSDTPSSQAGPSIQRRPSEEKEFYDLASAYLQTTPSNSTIQEPRLSLDWRSPFASPDPLSISIEEASTMILGSGDGLTVNTARSRSGTDSTVFVHAHTSGTIRENGTKSSDPNFTLANREPTSDNPNQLAMPDLDAYRPRTASFPLQLPRRRSAVRLREPDAAVRLHSARSSDSFRHSASRRPSEASHLSPKSATTEFGPRNRSNSGASTISSAKSTQAVEEPGEESQKKASSGHEAQVQSQEIKDETLTSALPSSLDFQDKHGEEDKPSESDDDLLKELDTIIKTALDSPAMQTSPKLIFPRPPFDPDHAQTAENAVENGTRLSPSMPTRQPPPPPPKPRRSNTKSTRVRSSSVYHIVNGTPSDTESSEDELYSTSKPASPSASARPTHLRIPSRDIPQVSIDGSACEEDGDDQKDVVDNKQMSEDVGTDAFAQYAILPQSTYTPPGSKSAQTMEEEGSVSAVTQRSRESSEERGDDREKFSPSLNEVPSKVASPPKVKDEEPAADASAGATPPLPPRPRRLRYRRNTNEQRPTPATTKTSPAAIPQESPTATSEQALQRSPATANEKELVPEAGLEVRPRLEVQTSSFRLNGRVSVDNALNIRSPSVSTQSTGMLREPGRHGRSASTSQVDLAQSTSDQSIPARAGFKMRGWYAPGSDTTSTTDLDTERIQHIVHFWNNSAWDQAEAYLVGYLESLIEQDALARARRVRHLLGVCASLKGQWSLAIPLFLSVMRTPIGDISEIDDGDCAAAYWLGDAYSLLNRRTEALLAYCIAERSTLFHDPAEPALSDYITAEQEAVQLGVSKAEFKIRWAQETWSSNTGSAESILDAKVITTHAAKMLLDNEPRKARRGLRDSSSPLNPNRARSNALFILNKVATLGKFHRIKLTVENFAPDTVWPLLYDPFFAMANVQRGRLLAYECDLLSIFNSNRDARIPRSGTLGLTRMDCFTCTDLAWLITTIRECLKVLEMEFSEVANVEGTWFVARYTFMQNRVATTNYFSIALFKQSLRSGYGVEIAPDGISSARILRSDYDHEKGVHHAESKRVKKLIRESLDTAAKERARINRQQSSSDVIGSAGDTDLAPPLPPRP